MNTVHYCCGSVAAAYSKQNLLLAYPLIAPPLIDTASRTTLSGNAAVCQCSHLYHYITTTGWADQQLARRLSSGLLIHE
jgi:hypothetical protein